MKKIFLFSLIAVVTFGAVCSNNSAFGGDVNSACYAVKGTYLCPVVPPVPHSYCGGKTASKWIGGLAGTSVGGVTGSIFGAFGSGAGAVAGGYVGAKLGAKIGTNYSANEYIYFEDGSCLECDSHDACEDFECPNRTVVTNGNVAYMCHVESSGDYWKKYDIPVCADSETNIDPNKKYKTYLKDNVTNNGKIVKDGVLVFSGSVCLYTEEVCPDCNKEQKQEQPKQKETKPKETKPTTQKCSQYKKNTDPYDCCMWNEGANAKANNTYTTWDETAQKCICSKGKWTKGGIVEAEDSPSGRAYYSPGWCTPSKTDIEKEKFQCEKLGKVWDAERKTCICGEGKKWVYDKEQNKGQCVDVDTPCTPSGCKITISQSIKCKNNSNSFNSVQTYNICKEDLDKWNIADTNCPEFQKKVDGCQNLECIAELLDQVNAYKKVIAAFCEDSSAPVYVPTTPDNSAQIAAAENKLTSFFRNAESNASVWKDKDGNFNTARLASDLTAGVILGTVGGVVSGVVIKKKQVEKGFDALHCTVGGQTVADWGDIFNVGLRR